MELVGIIINVLSNTELGVISSILTMPILCYVIKNQKQAEKTARNRDNAIATLLQCKMSEIHGRAIECRKDPELLPDETIENFYECYKQYKEMDGNGYADRMKRDMDEIRDNKLRGVK